MNSTYTSTYTSTYAQHCVYPISITLQQFKGEFTLTVLDDDGDEVELYPQQPTIADVKISLAEVLNIGDCHIDKIKIKNSNGRVVKLDIHVKHLLPGESLIIEWPAAH
jgi:hypothetical protein